MNISTYSQQSHCIYKIAIPQKKAHTTAQASKLLLCLFKHSSCLLLVSISITVNRLSTQVKETKQGLLIKQIQELANISEGLLVPSALFHWWAGVPVIDCMVANCSLVLKKLRKGITR